MTCTVLYELNLVEFGCVGAEIKWDTVVVCGCGVVCIGK